MRTILAVLMLLSGAWAQQMAPPENCANMTEDKVYKWNWVTKKIECIAVPAGGTNPDWSTIQNKPSTFTPSSHTHLKVDVTDFAVTWTEVSGKPATFAPSSHSHPESDITNLTTDLAGKAASVHSHAIADVTNLQTTLNGKAATSHTHAIADTTGLQTALDGKAASSHVHNANAACTGTDKVKGFDASGVPICAADSTGAGGLASGLIVFTLSTCPAGFTEVAGLNGKFILGTVAANSNQGTTGGQDTITEVINHTHDAAVTDPGHSHVQGVNSATTGGLSGYTPDTSSNTRVNSGYSTSSATTGITVATQNPAGGVASIDNRPAFIRLVGCSAN